MAVFTAGLVLLLDIWGGNRSGIGLSTDSEQEMADVHRCMQVLRGCEKRWQSAGKLWDLLYDLASIGRFPLPASANVKNKRERGAEEPKCANAAHPDSQLGPMPPQSGSDGNTAAREPRVIAGRHRPALTDVPIIMTAFGDPGSNPSSAGQPIAAGRHLHTSDVPAITTHFLPDFQPHSQAMGPDTPLSLVFTSTTSSICTVYAARRTTSCVPTPAAVNSIHLPVPVGSTLSPYFPMSEAFYEQLTASFSSVPNYNHCHPNSMPANTGQVRQGYTSEGGQHRASSDMGVDTIQGLVPTPETTQPNVSSGAHGVAIVPMPASMDQDSLAMWAAAHIGFELDDWESYLNTVNEIAQARMHTNGTLR
ncbi:hypothetical protein B0H11DRAFT_514405 [Mycena galericulata]|nr:hypothetical protein B0H11DRAFT_514405 [Mycena galericulata]